MKKINLFSLFFLVFFGFISCSTTNLSNANNENIIEVDTNHINFDFSKLKKDWIILENKTDSCIDISYLSMEENARKVMENEWSYVGIFHSSLACDNRIETRNKGKCIIETGNGNILSYSVSKLKNGILITINEFRIQPVETYEKEINVWAINELNGVYNERFIHESRYIANLRFSYNEDSQSLTVIDKYGQNPVLLNTLCSHFIAEHPELKEQKKITDSFYTFVFTNKSSGFELSAIENFDFQMLKHIAEMRKTHVMYRNQYYLKLNTEISDNVLELTFTDNNFRNNNPYGFKKNIYYDSTVYGGYILQWLDEGICLYDFAPNSVYTRGQGLSLIIFDSNVTNYPFDKEILFCYEGVYSYTTSAGGNNTVPKFRVIFSENEIKKNKTEENKIEKISFSSSFFRNNNPYGLSKNSKYVDDNIGKVLQWLPDGCLYDFSGGILDITWSCLAYLVLPEEDRNLFFDDSYSHYYLYDGVFSYETVNHVANTVPKLKIIFEKN